MPDNPIPSSPPVEAPGRIYLAPKCCSDPFEGRQWCEDNVWPVDGECDQSGIEYVRADLAALRPELPPTDIDHCGWVYEPDELPHDVPRGLLASLMAFVDEHGRGIAHEMGNAVILIDEAATALEVLKGRVEVLEAGLQLASNRLRMAAINAAPEGKREYYDYSEWADEAQALLNRGGAPTRLPQRTKRRTKVDP